MAFSVTPTAGTAPYTFTAEYANKLGFELGLYITEFRTETGIGSCPAPELIGANSATSAQTLLQTGTVVTTVSVPVGSCRNYINLVRRVSDNEIVSSMNIYIDNLA